MGNNDGTLQRDDDYDALLVLYVAHGKFTLSLSLEAAKSGEPFSSRPSRRRRDLKMRCIARVLPLFLFPFSFLPFSSRHFYFVLTSLTPSSSLIRTTRINVLCSKSPRTIDHKVYYLFDLPLYFSAFSFFFLSFSLSFSFLSFVLRHNYNIL